MSSETPPPPSSPIGTYGLLAFATLLYVPWLTALVATAPWTEPGMGGGETRMAEAGAELFTLALGIPLWLMLAGLLWLAGRKGHAPRAWAIASAILYGLAAIATLFAAGNYITWPGGGSIFVAALAPPLLALYGVSARLPAFAAGRPRFVPWLALGAAALVALSALPFAYWDPLGYPDRLAKEQSWAQVFAKRNADAVARAVQWEKDIGKLGPDSSFVAWLEYVNGATDGGALQEQAVEGARKAKDRQASVLALLGGGQIQRLTELWRFDISATPALCSAFDTALKQVATSDEPFEERVGKQLEWQLPNIKALLSAGCDLAAGLAAAETRAKKVAVAMPAFPKWEQFAATLAAPRRGP